MAPIEYVEHQMAVPSEIPWGGGRQIRTNFARTMLQMRFIMNAGRTSKQGQQINVGKDSDEYNAIVNTLTLHPEDLKALGVVAGGTVRVTSEYGGEATFRCQEGKVPRGMIFVPYGPPTCRLMGSETDGTGMPTSKNWEVEVEPVAQNAAPCAPA
jgi:formylmethanofuran dehydrogenase subunit D